MQADNDERPTLTLQDRQWLNEHRTDLWVAAQEGYSKRGRGAVLVIFEEIGGDEIVIAYTDQPNWATPTIAAQIAAYNPTTQMVIICIGQLDDPVAIVGPRAYVVQYLVLAA